MAEEPGGAARRAAVLCAALALLGASCGSAGRERESVAADGGIVRLDLRPIAPATGSLFSYRSAAGGRVSFIVYRESGGEPRAVLGACADCYRWRKGYRLEGDGVVCLRCGLRFRFDELGDGVGACTPIPLPAARADDRLEISVEALEAASRYF